MRVKVMFDIQLLLLLEAPHRVSPHCGRKKEREFIAKQSMEAYQHTRTTGSPALFAALLLTQLD